LNVSLYNMRGWKGIREKAREVCNTKDYVTNGETSRSILNRCSRGSYIFACLRIQSLGRRCQLEAMAGRTATGNTTRPPSPRRDISTVLEVIAPAVHHACASPYARPNTIDALHMHGVSMFPYCKTDVRRAANLGPCCCTDKKRERISPADIDKRLIPRRGDY
jgi:hypothetical protein